MCMLNDKVFHIYMFCIDRMLISKCICNEQKHLLFVQNNRRKNALDAIV